MIWTLSDVCQTSTFIIGKLRPFFGWPFQIPFRHKQSRSSWELATDCLWLGIWLATAAQERIWNWMKNRRIQILFVFCFSLSFNFQTHILTAVHHFENLINSERSGDRRLVSKICVLPKYASSFHFSLSPTWSGSRILTLEKEGKDEESIFWHIFSSDGLLCAWKQWAEFFRPKRKNSNGSLLSNTQIKRPSTYFPSKVETQPKTNGWPRTRNPSVRRLWSQLWM